MANRETLGQAKSGSCCVRSVARPKERLQPRCLLGCLCQARCPTTLIKKRPSGPQERISKTMTGYLLLPMLRRSRRGPCPGASQPRVCFVETEYSTTRAPSSASNVEKYSICVNRKLRRECPGNPVEAWHGGPQEDGEPRDPRPSQEWLLSVVDAPQSGTVAAGK